MYIHIYREYSKNHSLYFEVAQNINLLESPDWYSFQVQSPFSHILHMGETEVVKADDNEDIDSETWQSAKFIW